MFAPRLGLSNFTAIIDHNNLQGYGRVKDLCSFEPAKEKWEAFGWEAHEVDGHDRTRLHEVLAEPGSGKPRIIIARTVKGRGVSFMEDRLEWHYFMVTDEIRDKALKELS